MKKSEAVSEPGDEAGYAATFVPLAADYPTWTFNDDLKGRKEPLYGFHVWGPCPRCGHDTNALLPTKLVANSDAAVLDHTAAQVEAAQKALKSEDRGVGAAKPNAPRKPRAPREGAVVKVLHMTCACAYSHTGAPDKADGCGARWLVSVEYMPKHFDQQVHIAPLSDEDTSRLWQAAADVAEHASQSSATVASLAGKWVTVLGSLIGLVALAGILGGRDTLKALPWYAQLVIGMATAIALIANAVMIYAGNMASTGFPKVTAALDTRDLIDADLEPLKAAQHSTDKLKAARLAAFVASIAAAGAVGGFLFWPDESAGTTQVSYTVGHTSVTSPCVTLPAKQPDGKVSFSDSDGKATTIALSKVTAIGPCS